MGNNQNGGEIYTTNYIRQQQREIFKVGSQWDMNKRKHEKMVRELQNQRRKGNHYKAGQEDLIRKFSPGDKKCAMDRNGIHASCCSIVYDSTGGDEGSFVFDDPQHNSAGEYSFPDERVTKMMTQQRHGRFKFLTLDEVQKIRSKSQKSIMGQQPKADSTNL